ncbi:DegV family protein [Collinsella intestinalis]|uniref:DegV family protein n=1 Tax=Collinsella intestinalis TaxID=147207 RepID=UPI00195ED932|nr:DegV family protein [Collinsella intestinalis]MBM6682948.1 DegV family protein [Collinsella intestinalis]
MSWAIIADSSCNLRGYTPTAADTTYAVAPLKINVGGTEYVDDDNLDVAELNRLVAEEQSASSSSCPSVGEWAELFRTAEKVVAVTISANLSGSYEAAVMARDMVMAEGGHQIHLVNSRAAGGKLELICLLSDRYLTKYPEASFDEVCTYIDGVEAFSTVLFSLSSYENLTKSGRMPKMAGLLANKLNIRILGTASDEGTIKIVAPTRGQKKMILKVVQAMEGDGFAGGVVCIDHVENETMARELSTAIENRWPNAEVHIMSCGGLCSYYAEAKGLIIGYGWNTASGL